MHCTHKDVITKKQNKKKTIVLVRGLGWTSVVECLPNILGPGSRGSHVAQAGLKLTIVKDDHELLMVQPLPPEHQDSGPLPPHRFLVVLGMEPMASCMPGRHHII